VPLHHDDPCPVKAAHLAPIGGTDQPLFGQPDDIQQDQSTDKSRQSASRECLPLESVEQAKIHTPMKEPNDPDNQITDQAEPGALHYFSTARKPGDDTDPREKEADFLCYNSYDFLLLRLFCFQSRCTWPPEWTRTPRRVIHFFSMSDQGESLNPLRIPMTILIENRHKG